MDWQLGCGLVAMAVRGGVAVCVLLPVAVVRRAMAWCTPSGRCRGTAGVKTHSGPARSTGSLDRVVVALRCGFLPEGVVLELPVRHPRLLFVAVLITRVSCLECVCCGAEWCVLSCMMIGRCFICKAGHQPFSVSLNYISKAILNLYD